MNTIRKVAKYDADASSGGYWEDIKTVSALSSYAMTAITAVTSQNTMGVKSITSIPIKNFQKQIKEIKSKNIVNYYHRAKERRNFIDAYESCFR